MAEYEEFTSGPAGSESQELLRHIVNLSGAVGRIGGKLDAFLDKMQTQDRRLNEFEERLRKTEGHQYKVAGASGVVALLAGSFTAIASHFIKG